MPCIIIFVHGVNSEGEWYDDAEKSLMTGLNERLGRVDLRANNYKYGDPRALKYLDLQNSPVIRFYWGYRASKDQTDAGTFPWRVPLKTRVEQSFGDSSSVPYKYPSYSYKELSKNLCGKTYYWGGGPFQNGTTALNMSWYDGFDPKVWGINIGSSAINPERDRPLNACPKRTYYVNASKRLAKLIDTIYEAHPNDTIAVVSHSQGTMIASLAMFYVKKVPDTLLLCNSPYRLTQTRLDNIQMGNAAPTTKARVKTFFNLLQRFKML
jgi:pimeloyl-ACP methyl ester carboxylesterase